ncbi:sodium-dependent transporter [Halomarina ordinaria]|uniref:Sodium-dependent transporter n=1 Tax=Halomarina ordinaria TaxID=3033939 RepID=A0ABD5U5S4_9EURY|nr:sodium-dependent transporter [Halomarina sp. PSRA2]
MSERETWSTNLGFVLAAIGSAVGLGNIWRFPWLTAENGGSAFLVVYLGLVVAIGVPGLVAEFVIGRRGHRDPVGAFRALSRSRWWPVVGVYAVGTTLLVLTFYSVVGGWILRYTVGSLTGAYVADPATYFGTVSFGPEAVVAHLVFLGVVGAIIATGVSGGIERSSKAMMPAIVVLLGGLAVWAFSLPGAAGGYEFFLSFDVATLRENFLAILGPAAGQALFTLSLGAGSMLTYASYLDRDESLPADATVIAVANTLIGVLTGLVVFPLLFSQGLPPGSGGEGALFIALAEAFASLPAGGVVAPLFFGVVLLAAVSSAISMLETPVAYLVDEHAVPRRRATLGVVGLLAVTGSATALAPSAFGLIAGTLADLALTGGLLAFVVFVGWVLGRDAVDEYRAGAGSLSTPLAGAWHALVAWGLPVVLGFTLLTSLASLAGVALGVELRVALTLGALVVVRTLVRMGRERRPVAGAD